MSQGWDVNDVQCRSAHEITPELYIKCVPDRRAVPRVAALNREFFTTDHDQTTSPGKRACKSRAKKTPDVPHRTSIVDLAGCAMAMPDLYTFMWAMMLGTDGVWECAVPVWPRLREQFLRRVVDVHAEHIESLVFDPETFVQDCFDVWCDAESGSGGD